MTTPRIRAVGFCANYSPQGEWAFDLALDIAKRHRLQLNVFQFVTDPYRDASDDTVDAAPDLIEMEKRMRLHYDDRLGDYLEVGFRLCEDNEWRELHRCLCKQEFQLLVMAHPGEDAPFGKRRLLDFARDFACPVVLVGPDAPTDITLNKPARLIAYRIGLEMPAKRITHVTEALPYRQL